MHCVLWFLAGLLTAWLMYGHKETIPVFKTLVITLFGWLSLICWCLGNLRKCVPNPFYKEKSCC